MQVSLKMQGPLQALLALQMALQMQIPLQTQILFQMALQKELALHTLLQIIWQCRYSYRSRCH